MGAFKDLDITIQGIMNRLEKEKIDLTEKFVKLHKFVFNDKGDYTSIFQSLSHIEQGLIKKQLHTMNNYFLILVDRLKIMNEKYSS